MINKNELFNFDGAVNFNNKGVLIMKDRKELINAIKNDLFGFNEAIIKNALGYTNGDFSNAYDNIELLTIYNYMCLIS